MDPLTILIAIAGIVATGSLSKVGEHIADEAVLKSEQLLSVLRQKSPKTANSIEKLEQQPIDYGQAYLEIQTASKVNENLSQLLAEMQAIVLANSTLCELVEQELNEVSSQLRPVIEDWKGINIKGGTNTITGNTFQF